MNISEYKFVSSKEKNKNKKEIKTSMYKMTPLPEVF